MAAEFGGTADGNGAEGFCLLTREDVIATVRIGVVAEDIRDPQFWAYRFEWSPRRSGGSAHGLLRGRGFVYGVETLERALHVFDVYGA